MENNLKDQHYKNMGIMLQMETLTFEAESIACLQYHKKAVLHER